MWAHNLEEHQVKLSAKIMYGFDLSIHGPSRLRLKINRALFGIS